MDSLTQFALGAAISGALLAPKVGPRKAVLIGGLLGTLPDLDVLVPTADDVAAFVDHRGWSHAFFVHLLVMPVIGELLIRLFKGLRECRWRVWATVFLCLATHPVLDTLTVYGTRILLPFTNEPQATGSVFIIDLLYTLPLLVVLVWGLATSRWSKRFQVVTIAMLVISTAYLGQGLVVQQVMQERARTALAAKGIVPDKLLVQTAPFNSVVWRVLAMEDAHYHNAYLSLLDDQTQIKEPVIYTHPRNDSLDACVKDLDAFKRLAWFSRGYYELAQEQGKIIFSDLRMGLTPNHVFTFEIADVSSGSVVEIEPRRLEGSRSTAEGDFAWLWQRIKGEPVQRPAEQAMVQGNLGGAETSVASNESPCS